MSSNKRADNWVDGLRGIAALTVVTYHLCSCFANWLNSPAIEEKGLVSLFQYPFLRLIVGGRMAVALFFLITGYVNSFNTRKHIRNGDASFALLNLSKNTFNRTGRLVVPTNVALFMGWVVCQLHGYRLAALTDSFWIRVGAVPPGPTFGTAVGGLLQNLTLFWHGGVGIYDHTYWTIPFFMKGSMLVYLTLLGTSLTQPRYTRLIIIFLYLFAWSGGQALMELNIYAGMLLAELNAEYGSRATSLLSRPISALIILFGLFLASFPEEHAEWMPWSNAVNSVAGILVPSGGEINRYVISVGTAFIAFGAFFSRDARHILSLPVMNFLGRISFPIYLIHNTLIRTILSWLIYRDSAIREGMHPVDEKGNPKYLERGGVFTFIIVIPIFYAILIYASYLWTIYVDPPCAKAVTWLSRKAFGEDDGFGLTKEEILKGTLKT